MNVKKFIHDLYQDIWEGHDLTLIDRYYAKNVVATISVADEDRHPIDIELDYDAIVKQAHWQRDNYNDITFDFKIIFPGNGNKITALFHSQGVNKKTGELRNFRVMSAWELNDENQIQEAWAVMTPYYPFEHTED